MNRTQLEYAVRRLDHTYRDKVNDILAQAKKKEKKFGPADLIKAIKSGKLRPSSYWEDHKVNQFTSLSHLFENLDEFLEKEENNTKSLTQPIEAEYTRIKDQLYLGDAKEALAMIEAFAAKKF